MLTFDNFDVIVQNRKILKGINLSILPGGVFNFYGDNGIGKTSMLRSVAFLNFAQSSSLSYKSQPKLAEDSVYISLDLKLYPEQTVQQNLEFMASLYDNCEALAAAIHVLGLAQYLDTKYQDLSTGWQRKVVLSTLMLCQKDIWLIDEPFASLDQQSQKLVMNIIMAKASSGGIVILTGQNVIEDKDITNIALEGFKNITAEQVC